MIGVPEGFDASTPSTGIGLGIQKMAGSASQAALQPLTKAYVQLVEGAAEDISLMIQDSLDNDVNNFALGMGESAKMIIELGKEIPLCEFGIKIEYYADEEQRAYMEQRISNAEAAGQLRFEDAMMAQFIKNPKMLAVYMKNRRKVYQQEDMEKAKQLSESQGQSAAQAAQLAEQAKQQTLQMQTQANIEEAAAAHQGAKELEILKSQLRIQEIQASAAANAHKDLVVAHNSPQTTANATGA